MEKLFVVKIGGNVIDAEKTLRAFLEQFAALPGKKILVHGGGKLATSLAAKLGVEQQLVDGRRITDAETLKIITMVYAGYINKQLVAGLQAAGCQALGLCGADGDSIRAHKRIHTSVDYGYVGDVDAIADLFLKNLLNQGITLVFAPVTHDKKGQLLNTNADTIAQEIAVALSNSYEVSLVYSFEKSGVLRYADDEASVIDTIDPASYEELKSAKAVSGGMIPKLDNAFAALGRGVRKVIIGKAEDLNRLVAGQGGTTIRLGGRNPEL